MKRRVLGIIIGLLALTGYVGYETNVARRQEEILQTLRQRASQLKSELIVARRAHAAAARELAEAERQLASMPALLPARANIAQERRAEIVTWLKRVKRLRHLFDERPDQRIPEMEFLTDQDWLRVAKRVDLDAEDGERKAFAAIRDVAATHFRPQLSAALRKFAAAARENASQSASTFASFFDPPANPALLDRYEIAKTTEPHETAQRWRVQTKSPIDADYDSRHYVDAYADGRGYGGGSLAAPWAWIPDFRGQSERAQKAFSAANKGTSATGVADILPYFTPPLAPPLADKLIKAEREQKR